MWATRNAAKRETQLTGLALGEVLVARPHSDRLTLLEVAYLHDTALDHVSVPLQRSSTYHFVPTTVAALRLPFVWKRPLPSPHSRRFLTFFLAMLALPPPWQPVSFSVSVSVVRGFLPFFWRNLKSPS